MDPRIFPSYKSLFHQIDSLKQIFELNKYWFNGFLAMFLSNFSHSSISDNYSQILNLTALISGFAGSSMFKKIYFPAAPTLCTASSSTNKTESILLIWPTLHLIFHIRLADF